MPKTIKFGLIGCGKIAQRHANIIASEQLNNASLAAVCDLDRNKGESFAKKLNVSYYHDCETMAASDEIDAISILTPSGLHKQNVQQIVQYGKPIIIEKPLALRLDDADFIIKACEKNSVPLFVVKQNRFNLPVIQLRNAIEERRFGNLCLGTVRVRWCRVQQYYDDASWRGTWEFDGGVLTNQASHHIDLLLWMMGDVDSVYGMANKSLANIEAEDTAVVTLKFKSGALGIIEATTACRPKDLEGSLSILGQTGSVVIGGFSANNLTTWEFNKTNENDGSIYDQHKTNPQHPFGYAHFAYYEHVIDCIINQKKPLVDGHAARRSLEVIWAIYESIETGKEIKIESQFKNCKLGAKNYNKRA